MISKPSLFEFLAQLIFLKPPARSHRLRTVGQNKQEYRLEYWATRSFVCSFARTAHSFACSGLLASLVPSVVLTRSLARSFCSLSRSWDSEWLDGYLFCVLFYSGPQCSVILLLLLQSVSLTWFFSAVFPTSAFASICPHQASGFMLG